jgi:hypothetical protein
VVTDEDISPSAVIDCPLQDHKNVDNFGLSDSHTSKLNLHVSSQPSTTGLNTGHSPLESSLHDVNPFEIMSFP